MPPTLKHLNIVKTVNFTLSVFYHNLKKKKDRNTPEILLVLECLTDKVGDGDMSKGTGTQRVGKTSSEAEAGTSCRDGREDLQDSKHQAAQFRRRRITLKMQC